MTEILNSDDVELIIEPVDANADVSLARVEVDEMVMTNSQTLESHAGVGSGGEPKGLSSGDREYTFSYTLLGQSVSIYQTVAGESGEFLEYNMTARVPIEDTNVDEVGDYVEFAMTGCKSDEEQLTFSSDEAAEYAVSGMATSYDRDVF